MHASRTWLRGDSHTKCAQVLSAVCCVSLGLEKLPLELRRQLCAINLKSSQKIGRGTKLHRGASWGAVAGRQPRWKMAGGPCALHRVGAESQHDSAPQSQGGKGRHDNSRVVCKFTKQCFGTMMISITLSPFLVNNTTSSLSGVYRDTA